MHAQAYPMYNAVWTACIHIHCVYSMCSSCSIRYACAHTEAVTETKAETEIEIEVEILR